MARQITPLTDRKIRSTRPEQKPKRLFDGNGLYLDILPSGKKVWRFKSKLKSGRNILLTFGEYPLKSLNEARLQRDEARDQISKGLDPRTTDAKSSIEDDPNEISFESLSLEWLATREHLSTPRYLRSIVRTLEKYVFPALGGRLISEISPRLMLRVFQEIEKTGFIETSVRARSYCSRVFGYAISIGLIERNPVFDLKDILRKPERRHYPSIRKEDLPMLLQELHVHMKQSSASVSMAMKMLLMLFPRVSELVGAEWSELDLQKGIWIIPWQRMKMGRKKVNPDRTDLRIDLPNQAVRLFTNHHQLTGHSRFVFCSPKDNRKPICPASLNRLISETSFKGRMTIHGFRALAASSLDEMGHPSEIIEKQLSHRIGNRTFSAYHRAEFIEERKRMLQDWADYIHQLCSQHKIDDFI